MLFLPGAADQKAHQVILQTPQPVGQTAHFSFTTIILVLSATGFFYFPEGKAIEGVSVGLNNGFFIFAP